MPGGEFMKQADGFQLLWADFEIQMLGEIFPGGFDWPAARDCIAADDCLDIGQAIFSRCSEAAGQIAKITVLSGGPAGE